MVGRKGFRVHPSPGGTTSRCEASSRVGPAASSPTLRRTLVSSRTTSMPARRAYASTNSAAPASFPLMDGIATRSRRNETSVGQVDANVALKGSPAGFEGPWGKTFAKNLRLTVKDMSEDDWVKFSDTFQAAPPMPWYNVHAFTDVEARSLYQYIKSLPGDLGEQAPPAIPPA